MIDQPYTPLPYTIPPARGQALLSFAGRRMPDHLPLFEVTKIEEVRPPEPVEAELKLNDGPVPPPPGLLLHGDCLSACAYLKANNLKVDLVYIDPPFASGANYAKKVLMRNASESPLDSVDSIGEEIMYGDIWQKEDFLNWLYERLLAIREALSETGSIYVHLDRSIGHYGKVLLDEVFGDDGFLNEIVWKRTSARSDSQTYNHIHDVIFFYAKSDLFSWNPQFTAHGEEYEEERYCYDDGDGRKYQLTDMTSPNPRTSMMYVWKGFPPPEKGWRFQPSTMAELDAQGRIWYPEDKAKRPRLKRYLDESKGRPLDSVWMDVFPVNSQADERLNYPTQKPEELLQRIITASSDPGMTVADFFSGSGTTATVAHKLGRRFIASDIGLNAIQTTRDRLAAAGASFDVLKIQDGVRLFRNPAQTMAKIFSLVEGFKRREELELGEFWDGGLPGPGGRYIPLKFVGLHERLTPVLVDYYIEEICQLETDERAEGVRILYAHREPSVDQNYINQRLKQSRRTSLKVELISLNQLLDKKGASLFTPDSAILEVTAAGKGKWQVAVKQYFSTYLSNKITEFNAKRGKKERQDLHEGDDEDKADAARVQFTPVTISETGLELIEAIQFDTTLRKDGVWISDPDLEDKAGPKQKVKGTYRLSTKSFRIRIRNIAGDEITLDPQGQPV
jgi:adenine-specific DNA-methyltransferase